MEKISFLKLKPMLLSEKSDVFNDDNYIFELKFDGIRAIILVKNGEIIIKSKNGIILNDIYPELEEIVNITKDVCIFDGEIILLENGKPSFSKVMERFKNLYPEVLNEMQTYNYDIGDIIFVGVTNFEGFERAHFKTEIAKLVGVIGVFNQCQNVVVTDVNIFWNGSRLFG